MTLKSVVIFAQLAIIMLATHTLQRKSLMVENFNK